MLFIFTATKNVPSILMGFTERRPLLASGAYYILYRGCIFTLIAFCTVLLSCFVVLRLKKTPSLSVIIISNTSKMDDYFFFLFFV